MIQNRRLKPALPANDRISFKTRDSMRQRPIFAKRNPILSAPNLVSFSRIPMGALAWLHPLDPAFILGLMALAAVSDVLDGWLERHLSARRGGLRLDEIFLALVLGAVMAARKSALFPLPLIATREAMQTAAALGWALIPGLRGHLDFRLHASALGKAVTTGQFLAIGVALLGLPGQALLAALTGVLGFAAGTDYVVRAWRRREAGSCVL